MSSLSLQTPASSSCRDGVVTVATDHGACSQCAMQQLCMPSGLTSREMERLDAIVGAPRKLAHGRSLYRNGDGFASVYMIKAGSFKTVVQSIEGYQQVVGFQMAGEILGLDGIGSGVHTCDAVALEDSRVCCVPFHEFETLAREIPVFQRHVHRLMSLAMISHQGVMLLLGTMHADGRLATFLLNLSQRLAVRGYAPLEFHMRMTREEIGSYLGLGVETTSRTFMALQDNGILAVERKYIRILDLDRLRRLSPVSSLRRLGALLPPRHVAPLHEQPGACHGPRQEIN